jgi:hypothetical protein
MGEWFSNRPAFNEAAFADSVGSSTVSITP